MYLYIRNQHPQIACKYSFVISPLHNPMINMPILTKPFQKTTIPKTICFFTYVQQTTMYFNTHILKPIAFSFKLYNSTFCFIKQNQFLLFNFSISIYQKIYIYIYQFIYCGLEFFYFLFCFFLISIFIQSQFNHKKNQISILYPIFSNLLSSLFFTLSPLPQKNPSKQLIPDCSIPNVPNIYTGSPVQSNLPTQPGPFASGSPVQSNLPTQPGPFASGSSDNSIRLWDIKTGKEIQSADKSYKDILAQFKTPLFQNDPLPQSISTNITILLISQQAIFQAQGALILKGEFVNQSGIDLKTLFKQKGSCILENQVELQQK